MTSILMRGIAEFVIDPKPHDQLELLVPLSLADDAAPAMPAAAADDAP